MRGFTAAITTLLLLLILACQTGGGDSIRSSEEPAIDLVSAEPLEVLKASAETLQEEVDTYHGTFRMTMTISGDGESIEMNGTGEVSFQAPDAFYMTMDWEAEGEEFSQEVLGRSGKMYMRMTGIGLDEWIDMTPPGLDEVALADLGQQFQMTDYAGMIEEIGGEVEDFGLEELEGKPYQHYRARLDLLEITESLNSEFDLGLDLEGVPFDEADFDMTLDVWLEPATLLPFQTNASAVFEFGDEFSMTMKMAMLYGDFEAPVEIPEAPEDAISFEDALFPY